MRQLSGQAQADTEPFRPPDEDSPGRSQDRSAANNLGHARAASRHPQRRSQDRPDVNKKKGGLVMSLGYTTTKDQVLARLARAERQVRGVAPILHPVTGALLHELSCTPSSPTPPA